MIVDQPLEDQIHPGFKLMWEVLIGKNNQTRGIDFVGGVPQSIDEGLPDCLFSFYFSAPGIIASCKQSRDLALNVCACTICRFATPIFEVTVLSDQRLRSLLFLATPFRPAVAWYVDINQIPH